MAGRSQPHRRTSLLQAREAAGERRSGGRPWTTDDDTELKDAYPTSQLLPRIRKSGGSGTGKEERAKEMVEGQSFQKLRVTKPCVKDLCACVTRVACDKVVCDKAVRVRELRVTKLCACVTMSCV